MSITIVSQGRDVSPWVKAFKAQRPDLPVHVYPETGPTEEVRFVLAWNHPLGAFKHFPNLKCIASMGAGVDHILKDPDLPKQAVVTRVTDENLTKDMAVFTASLALSHTRNLYTHKLAENDRNWQPLPYLRPQNVTVSVMGLGVLGAAAAEQLVQLGFKVTGWATSEKNIAGVKVYTGPEALDAFLATAQILVCLLPLTPETAGILNKSTFKKLPEGAFVINVARGEHLVEEDLLEMLDSGHLSGASLDVFKTEPLPQQHAFWAHPKVHITPHIASVTDPATVVTQLLENYDRLQQNEPLANIVSRTKGY